jgi:hypothetical protein
MTQQKSPESTPTQGDLEFEDTDGELPVCLAYSDMTPEQQKAYDTRQGISKSARESYELFCAIG